MTMQLTEATLKTFLAFANDAGNWCSWERKDGSYVKVSKREFLKNIGADTPNDGAHGGRADHTPVHAKIEDDEVHVG